MALKHSNRIPAEELEACHTWRLPDIDAGGNIVPSAQKQARDQHRAEQRAQAEIIEDIDGDAVDYAPMTAQQLQEITEAAEKEGYTQGHEKGYQAGQAEGYQTGLAQGAEDLRQQLEQQQQRLGQIADNLLQPLQAQDDTLEKVLVDLVCDLSQAVIKRELLTDSTHVLELVQAALAALPTGTNNFKLYLNPDDLALVEAFAEERQKDWQFQGDTDLLPGGCRIESQESLVDFSVEHRMAVLFDQFINKQLAATAQPTSAQSETDQEKTAAELDSAVTPESPPDKEADS